MLELLRLEVGSVGSFNSNKKVRPVYNTLYTAFGPEIDDLPTLRAHHVIHISYFSTSSYYDKCNTLLLESIIEFQFIVAILLDPKSRPTTYPHPAPP